MLNYSKPTPSQKYLQENYEYDPSSKVFPLKRRFDASRGPVKKGFRIGSIKLQEHRGNYLQVQAKINYTPYTLSRLIWKYHYGVEPKGVIDHINGDSTDNRIENLQDITHQQNLNKKPGEIINAA
jgi:hypothetical protein